MSWARSGSSALVWACDSTLGERRQQSYIVWVRSNCSSPFLLGREAAAAGHGAAQQGAVQLSAAQLDRARRSSADTSRMLLRIARTNNALFINNALSTIVVRTIPKGVRTQVGRPGLYNARITHYLP